MSNEKRESLKVINHKKESREIAKKILDFGVTDQQKIDIMINLALSLEDHEKVREIVNFLKKFSIVFNLEEKDAKIDNEGNSKPKKILLN